MAQRKPMSPAQVVLTLATTLEMPKQQVKAVLDELINLAGTECAPKSRTAPGTLTIPGICKVVAVKKPAKKARKGINPFTGEAATFKARPASVAVKLRPLKAIKDAIN